MNIQQTGLVDKANFTYSMNSLLQPQRERQAEEALTQNAPPLGTPLNTSASTEAPLPTLGRYINIWA